MDNDSRSSTVDLHSEIYFRMQVCQWTGVPVGVCAGIENLGKQGHKERRRRSRKGLSRTGSFRDRSLRNACPLASGREERRLPSGESHRGCSRSGHCSGRQRKIPPEGRNRERRGEEHGEGGAGGVVKDEPVVVPGRAGVCKLPEIRSSRHWALPGVSFGGGAGIRKLSMPQECLKTRVVFSDFKA